MFGQIEPKEADPRVRLVLEERELRYDVNEGFNFTVGFNLGDGRSQMVIICSQTYEFAGVELREIKSAALRSQGPFDARTANLLLSQNEILKLGAWGVTSDSEDNHLAIFSVKVTANLGAEEMENVLRYIAECADTMEDRLSGRDDY